MLHSIFGGEEEARLVRARQERPAVRLHTTAPDAVSFVVLNPRTRSHIAELGAEIAILYLNGRNVDRLRDPGRAGLGE